MAISLRPSIRSGTLIPILDPLNNHQPFPGNIIPAESHQSRRPGLLNVFPLPNFNNPAVSSNQYNYIYQPYLTSYNNYHFYRVDWDPTEKLRMFWRLDYDPVDDTGLFGANWPAVDDHRYLSLHRDCHRCILCFFSDHRKRLRFWHECTARE